MDDLVTRHGTTAEEILYVLNGRRTVSLRNINFIVITGIYTPHRLETADWPFTPGEIFPVAHDQAGSREFLGQARDPYADWEDSSWCLHHEEAIANALDVSELVTSDRPRGYYTWTSDGLSFGSDQDAGHRQWAGGHENWIRVGDYTGRGTYAEMRERQQTAAEGGADHADYKEGRRP